MFSVVLYNQGYRISVGDGKPASARSLAEVQQALAHYYGSKDHRPDADACPFCHQVAVANERPVIQYQDCGCRIRAKIHTCHPVGEENTS